MSKNGSAYLLETTPVETGDGTPLGAVIIFKRSDHKEPRLWNVVKARAPRLQDRAVSLQQLPTQRKRAPAPKIAPGLEEGAVGAG